MKRHGGKKCVLLNERCQSEKPTYCIIPNVPHRRKGKATETIKRSVIARGEGGGSYE